MASLAQIHAYYKVKEQVSPLLAIALELAALLISRANFMTLTVSSLTPSASRSGISSHQTSMASEEACAEPLAYSAQ